MAQKIAELAVNAINCIQINVQQFKCEEDYNQFDIYYEPPQISDLCAAELIELFTAERYKVFGIYNGYSHCGYNPINERVWNIVRIYDMAINDMQK